MFSLVFLAVAIVGAAIHLVTGWRPRTSARAIEVLLLWALVILVGALSLFAGLAHLFAPDPTARGIGWPTGNPFQFEVGMADVAVGIAGILCIWLRGGFWLATGLISSIFFIGAAYGHIYQLVVNGDHAPDNAGAVLYTDIAYPVVVLVLLVLHYWLKAGRRRETPYLARPTTSP